EAAELLEMHRKRRMREDVPRLHAERLFQLLDGGGEIALFLEVVGFVVELISGGHGRIVLRAGSALVRSGRLADWMIVVEVDRQQRSPGKRSHAKAPGAKWK